MNQTILFPMSPVRTRASLMRSQRIRDLAKWKREHRIYTHKCPNDWLALSLTKCVQALKGYPLTQQEQNDGAELIAGYCRLLDELDLIHYGHSEHAACKELVLRIQSGGLL